MEWVTMTVQGSFLWFDAPVARVKRWHGSIDSLAVDMTCSRDVALAGSMLGAIGAA
jgi:hypothetical protein